MGCRNNDDGQCALRGNEDEGLHIDTRGRCLGEDGCIFAGPILMDESNGIFEDEENFEYQDEEEDPLG